LISISPWTLEESTEFFKNSFEKHAVKIETSKITYLAPYSVGLPVVAHELGHAVWEEAEDGQVATNNVVNGLFVAAERVGARFLESGVIQALQSTKYRSILRKIAKKLWLDGDFSKTQLHSLPLTADEKKNLDNFLNRARKLCAIVPVQDGRRGVYRCANRLHSVYFYIEASRH